MLASMLPKKIKSDNLNDVLYFVQEKYSILHEKINKYDLEL